MANLKHRENDMAVSPIVATLVLIVVAVIGAVAVGTIMGTFSTDVSKQTNANQAAGASATEILVAGSTTVDPVTQAMAHIYEASNPGVKIVSQATGSGAGFQAMTLGVADIGAMSEAPGTARLSQNPNTVVYRIGSGAVAIITNHHLPGIAANSFVTPTALYGLYNASTPPAPFTSTAIPVTRADSSGTADTLFHWAGSSQANIVYTTNIVRQSGNAALVNYVGSTDNAVGFGDFGYVYGRTDVDMLAIDDGIHQYPGVSGSASTSAWNTQYTNLTSAAQAEYRNNVEGTVTSGQGPVTQYNLSLIHPLNYMTNGQPSSSIIENFINFARSGSATPAFQQTHTFSLSQIF